MGCGLEGREFGGKKGGIGAWEIATGSGMVGEGWGRRYVGGSCKGRDRGCVVRERSGRSTGGVKANDAGGGGRAQEDMKMNERGGATKRVQASLAFNNVCRSLTLLTIRSDRKKGHRAGRLKQASE